MRSKAESFGLDQSLGWSALSVRSDLDKFGYWRGDSSFFWDIHPGHRFPFPAGNVPRCLIYRPGVPHTLLLMKELTAQEMKCGNEQTLLEFTVLPSPSHPEAAGLKQQCSGLWRPESQVSSGGKYLAGLGCCSSGGCINSKGAFPEDTVVKNPFGNAGDTSDRGSIPGLGRSPGGRNGKLIQYSCLENSDDRGKAVFSVLIFHFNNICRSSFTPLWNAFTPWVLSVLLNIKVYHSPSFSSLFYFGGIAS